MLWVAMYLIAACMANVVVSIFGYSALPFTAAILIPFDMTSRDVLHDRWKGNWLIARMSMLVWSGSLMAWFFCSGDRMVCIASGLSFMIAGAVDCLVYALSRSEERVDRMLQSNVMSSIIDSTVFPLIAFGSIDPFIAISQATLKIVGGTAFVFTIHSWSRANES